MSDYAIGDVQGCYTPLMRLLDAIDFNEHTDTLWFVGDLVNRGPQSLEVLRFIKSLPRAPRIALGNHDLHYLALLGGATMRRDPDDTLQELLRATDSDELGYWLRHQSFLCYSPELNVVMTHAGIAPVWDLSEARTYAQELEAIIQGDGYIDFLSQIYGNAPNEWSLELTGMARWRLICNFFTRMRFCDAAGRLNLTYKGGISNAPPGLYPWFAVPNRRKIEPDIVFGHWSTLAGEVPHPTIHAIDTGCVWGEQLTALRLQDKQRFMIAG